MSTSERVGFGRRFVAGLIDGILCTIAGMVLGSVLGGSLPVTASVETGSVGDLSAMTGAIVGQFVFMLAYGLIEGLRGASPGKMLLGIIIRNEDGTPAATETLLKRFAIKNAATFFALASVITTIGILYAIGMVVGFLVMLGCFLVLGASKQALHDRLVRTAVYRT